MIQNHEDHYLSNPIITEDNLNLSELFSTFPLYSRAFIGEEQAR